MADFEGVIQSVRANMTQHLFLLSSFSRKGDGMYVLSFYFTITSY